MKVLVTGGAGFIGSHVVDRLIAAGYEVLVVDDLSTGERGNIHPGARFYQLSILAEELAHLLEAERPAAVIHLAAQVDAARSVNEPLLDVQTNAVGSLHLLASCCAAGVRRFVHTSSAAIYGDPVSLPVTEDHPCRPLSPYGIHKEVVGRYLEFYRRQAGLEFADLCLANVYGPRQRIAGEGAVVPAFISRLLRGEHLVIYGDGRQTRDFVYVTDVAEAVVRALENPVNQRVNISSGQAVSVLALAELVAQVCSLPVEVEHAPPRPGDIRHSVLSNERAYQLLGWRPRTGLRAGLAATVEFIARHLEPATSCRQVVRTALQELAAGGPQTAVGEDPGPPGESGQDTGMPGGIKT